MLRFCIINCENSKKWSPISFGDMFRQSLQQTSREESWDVVNIAEGEILPSAEYMLETYKGIVITGSHFNVRDGLAFISGSKVPLLPWFNSLCELIQQIFKEGKPNLYGGCFG